MSKIKIIGIGCSGISITNRLKKSNQKNIIYSVIAADKNLLDNSFADEKIFIDNNSGGIGGFCGNVKKAETTIKKYQNEINNILSASEQLIIVSALGGGTGSGITPFVVKMASDMNIPNNVILIKPFDFESENHKNNALYAINKIKTIKSDIFILENQKICNSANEQSSLSDAFKIIDDEIINIINNLNL